MKRESCWASSKADLSETCEEDTPNSVAEVDTTPSTTVDHAVTAAVQERLAGRDLVPREHLVDTSYGTADHLVRSKAEHD